VIAHAVKDAWNEIAIFEGDLVEVYAVAVMLTPIGQGHEIFDVTQDAAFDFGLEKRTARQQHAAFIDIKRDRIQRFKTQSF
jgi:hypothetical protein